jgi:diguanylate cyclase (GGDEF)-like protein
MFASRQRNRQNERVPSDIYISLVDSLFDNFTSMFAGAVCATAGAILTAWKGGHWFLWASALGILLVGIGRALHMRAYARSPKPTTVEEAWECERHYAFGAGSYALMLGMWSFFGIALTTDPVIHLLCAAVTIGYTAGGAGRNSGRPHIVLLQIICACGPLAVALMLNSSIYYVGLGILIILFFMGLKRISYSLHTTNLKALVASRDIQSLAMRFDTALNNMPHGLCMFDAQGRVVVSNSRLTELLGVARDIAERGVTARELLQECAQAGSISPSSVERFAAHFESHLTGRGGADPVIEIQGGRTLALTFQPMENGGSVVLAEDITERRNAEAKINHMARFDAVTGLPNRTFFRDQIDRALAITRLNGQSCAVLFIDLDDFKQINDTLGHPCGDQLLCAVADRLRRIVRDSDVVARFGGDEFVVFQSPIKHPDDASTMAARVVEQLGEPYEIEGHHVVIGASVGIALVPDESISADHLLKNADMALYRAKSDGRSTWRFFEPDMAVKAQARRSLELDLRNALANESFQVFYQPLVNLKTMRISTCEALLRWPHPERGMVSPAEFIPIAEEMGLIVEMGRWVLRQACLECAKWPTNARVAVNLSPIQFRRGDVMADVRDALAASGLPADRLELEITESVLLQDTQATRAALDQLRQEGVRISLDDFGTGYSSLSYLHAFPLNKVKIDRSFLKGLGAGGQPMTLLRGVARLSAELGMSVVIEGVETEEQLALIAAEASIDEAQGYLFSPPVPGRQLRTLLQAVTPVRKVA